MYPLIINSMYHLTPCIITILQHRASSGSAEARPTISAEAGRIYPSFGSRRGGTLLDARWRQEGRGSVGEAANGQVPYQKQLCVFVGYMI